MGEFDDAERMYRQFLQDHPDDSDIHLQLGHLFNRKGEPAAALTFYEQALKLAPDDAEIALHADLARRNVGRAEGGRSRDAAMAFVAAGRWEEARGLLRSLVAIDGEKDLIGILANVTKETGRLDEAATLYAGYLRYAMSGGKAELVADCYRQLGHLHKIKGDYAAAADHFLHARKLERVNGADEQEDSGLDNEIFSCLREIYPCFAFHD
jgi:tetratricopeptide (TPR) repeat protein